MILSAGAAGCAIVGVATAGRTTAATLGDDRAGTPKSQRRPASLHRSLFEPKDQRSQRRQGDLDRRGLATGLDTAAIADP